MNRNFLMHTLTCPKMFQMGMVIFQESHIINRRREKRKAKPHPDLLDAVNLTYQKHIGFPSK